MAEVLGLVASGMSVAQIAGSIVTTSLKLKRLLDEVKGAPENLRDMLDHLELLAPILYEATAESDDATCTSLPLLSAHSNVQHALQKAYTACKSAGEQLELVASDLMSQIDMARGGMRRKRAMFKVVLKKGTLTQCEMRLQRAIQLLTLAQNAYIVALQRTHPEIIVSQIMSALAQSNQADHSHAEMPQHQTPSELQVVRNATDRRTSSGQQSGALHQVLQLGLVKMTGLVRFYTQSKDTSLFQTTGPIQDQLLRLQVQMPTWLCTSILDAALSRSYAGWTCSLRMYGYIWHGSAVYALAGEAIENDDVDKIHGLFQERLCSPLDHLVFGSAKRNYTLVEHALSCGAWRMSGYLLRHGAEYDNAFGNVQPRDDGTQSNADLEHFLIHNELSDPLAIRCLASYWGNVKSFTDLVSRIWPYGEFYETAFEDERLHLAKLIVANFGAMLPSSSPAILNHLFGTLSLEDAESTTAMEVLSCLATGLGGMIWHDPAVANEWHSVILGTALRLNKAHIMPEQHPSGAESFGLTYPRLSPMATPLTNLCLASMIALPGHNRDRNLARQHKMRGRLAHCEAAVQLGLKVLQRCGIDLKEYGKQEKKRLRDHECCCDFRIFRDVWYDRVGVSTRNGLFHIRLISFDYGSRPEDWKLWWSEPTDELVGDFWREIEPEELYIPGSWNDD